MLKCEYQKIKKTKSRTQLVYNIKIEGGFLQVLTGLIPFLTGTVLPALGLENLSGLASTGVQKLTGNGLYHKKEGCVCQTETDGRGLYLGPASGNGFETVEWSETEWSETEWSETEWSLLDERRWAV